MSFFAAIALGAGALMLLWLRPATDIGGMAVAAFLATAFWIGLLLSGLWPGASFGFARDPGFTAKPPVVLGVELDPNAVLAAACTLVGWAGFALVAWQ